MWKLFTTGAVSTGSTMGWIAKGGMWLSNALGVASLWNYFTGDTKGGEIATPSTTFSGTMNSWAMPAIVVVVLLILMKK